MSKRTTGTVRNTSRRATRRKRSAMGCNRSRSVWKPWSRRMRRYAKSLQSFTPGDSKAKDNCVVLKGDAEMTSRPPLPPFTHETAVQKVRLAEDGWNTRDPEKVALAYALDSRWRNRSEFIKGRNEIIPFLSRKWAKELDYRLIKELWTFTGSRIAVRFAYEWH